jgi:hypothetical protein
MGLSFTTAAGPHQRSHYQVRVPRDSWPHFTVSDSRLPQPGGSDPRIYIPQEQGGPVVPPGTEFPFRRLLRLAGLRWRYQTPPPHGSEPSSKLFPLITPRHGPTENTALLLLRACMLRPLPSNGHCLQSHRLATGLYATIFRWNIFDQLSGYCLLFKKHLREVRSFRGPRHDQMKKDVICWACVTHRKVRMHTKSSSQTWRGETIRRQRHRWKANIKMDLKCAIIMDWIQVAQNRALCGILPRRALMDGIVRVQPFCRGSWHLPQWDLFSETLARNLLLLSLFWWGVYADYCSL